jgi:signal transduction histidine kinase
VRPTPAQTERDETDANLLTERTATDAELVKKRTENQEDEDRIVKVARDRAEATLREARRRTDRDMRSAGAGPDLRSEIEAERQAEDLTAAGERLAADERLRVEREQHRRALGDLLRLEREATDEGLLIERARADETVSTRDDFLGIVSHDLQGMLSGISLSAGMFAKHATDAGDAEAQLQAERILRCAARMNRLVTDLLDVVSLEAGMLRINPALHDAVELGTEVVEAFQTAFVAKGVALTMGHDTNEIVAKYDHERIFQALSNLMSNALKFTEPGGTVGLMVERADSALRFSVTDTGKGIPADQVAAVFERFRQVKRDRRGLGLGLYIARCIVEAHGGKIWAESPGSRGTAVRFTLPALGPG